MNAVTLYNEIWSSTSELEELCKRSLNPRGSDMLYELFAGFGPTAQSEVIDIGCRDASYAIELATRCGCRVLGIDPAPRPRAAGCTRRIPSSATAVRDVDGATMVVIAISRILYEFEHRSPHPSAFS